MSAGLGKGGLVLIWLPRRCNLYYNHLGRSKANKYMDQIFGNLM